MLLLLKHLSAHLFRLVLVVVLGSCLVTVFASPAVKGVGSKQADLSSDLMIHLRKALSSSFLPPSSSAASAAAAGAGAGGKTFQTNPPLNRPVFPAYHSSGIPPKRPPKTPHHQHTRQEDDGTYKDAWFRGQQSYVSTHTHTLLSVKSPGMMTDVYWYCMSIFFGCGGRNKQVVGMQANNVGAKVWQSQEATQRKERLKNMERQLPSHSQQAPKQQQQQDGLDGMRVDPLLLE